MPPPPPQQQQQAVPVNKVNPAASLPPPHIAAQLPPIPPPLPPPPTLPKSPKNVPVPQTLMQQSQQQNASLHLLKVQKRKNDELANIKDDNVRRVLMELSTPHLPQANMVDTRARVAQLIGPLFYNNFEQRKDRIIGQSN